MTRETTTPREFRVRKSLGRVAVACLVLFCLMMVGTAVGMAVDPPPNPAVPVPVLTAIFVSFWGVFAGGAVWMLLACRHSILTIDEYGITQQGIRSRRSLGFSEVAELQWCVAPRGVVIRTAGRPLKIDLPDFVPEEQLWIIRFFRSRIDEPRQTGWHQFCHAVANPIRQMVEEGNRPLKADEALITRGRIDRFSIAATILCLLFADSLAAVLNRPLLLLLPLVPAILGVLFRSWIPKEGMRDRKLDRDNLRPFAGVGLWTAAILTAMGLRLRWVTFIGIAGMTVWGVRQMIRDSRRKAQTDRDEIPRALQEWEARRGLP